VTDARLNAEDSKVLREVVRRAGHEIRNALNGIAVNVEVVRGRSTREAGSSEITPFAERAILQVSAASVLTNGLLALVNATLGGVGGKGTAERTTGSVELRLNDASATLSDIQRLAAAIGVSVEQRGINVILKVLPQGQSHSKD
jgi:hypothetical protein